MNRIIVGFKGGVAGCDSLQTVGSKQIMSHMSQMQGSRVAKILAHSARANKKSSLPVSPRRAPTQQALYKMSNARHLQPPATTTTETMSNGTGNGYKANISSLSFCSGWEQPFTLGPTRRIMTANKMVHMNAEPRNGVTSMMRTFIISQPLDAKINRQLRYLPCPSLGSLSQSIPPANITCENSESGPAKALFLSGQQEQRKSTLQEPSRATLPIHSTPKPMMNLAVSQLLSTMTNQVVASKPVSMLSNVFARFMTTLQGPNINSLGSGRSFEDEQEMLLSNSKANKIVKINACGELYNELARTKPHLFGTSPKGRGIDFDVQYYDSLDLIRYPARVGEAAEPPVVCLLHGAPGHYKDFSSLMTYLTAKNIRVVAPNFPDYSATFEHSFRHSSRERLDYLLNFFKAIKLNKIDMMIGHSSAVYTMFELLGHTMNDKNPAPIIRSLGLFSVPSHELPSNMSVTPFRLLTLRLFDFPLMRPLIVAMIQTFVKLQGIRNRVDKDRIENLLIAASAVGYSEHPRMKDHLSLIHKFKIPVFMLVGTSDKLIPMESFNNLKADLGITSEDEVKFYHSNGGLAKDVVIPNHLIDVSQFDNGGHYTFQRYSAQVNEDVYKFLLNRVIKDSIESTKL